MQQIPFYGRYLGYRYPHLSQSMVTSLPSNSHSGILYHMGNDWGFSSISHSMGKCNKANPTGETWDVDTHTIPKVWLILYHQIPNTELYIIWEMQGFIVIGNVLVNISNLLHFKHKVSVSEQVEHFNTWP